MTAVLVGFFFGYVVILL